jgi:UDP-galactopyranose mutase
MYDCLVVGAGIFGATVARRLADRGQRVLIIDRRDTIAGNLRCERREGVLIHSHGPHVLHMNDREVWDFLGRFARLIPYRHRARTLVEGRLYSFPINLTTLNQRWGVRTPREAEEALQRVRVTRPPGRGDLESWVKSRVGEELYEAFYREYTEKQWGRSGREVPEGVARRLPIRTDGNDEYFDDEYQGIPEDGYTALIENMLQGIEVRLGADFNADRAFWLAQASRVVYGGSPDELFDHDLGRLEYRSTKLVLETHAESVQGCPTVNHPDARTPWTRVTEFNYFPPNRPGGPTVIMKEIPEAYDGSNERYYPINDGRNSRLAAAYAEKARAAGIILGGRLGSYRYYDIHHVVGQANKIAAELLERGVAAGSGHAVAKG